MLKTANASFILGTISWREQFVDALTVSAGDDDDEDEDDPSCEEPHVMPEVSDGELHRLASRLRLAR